jgi:hypothetical protein
MPRVSERASFFAEFDFVLRLLIMDGKENTRAFTEVLEMKIGLLSVRNLNPIEPIPKIKALNALLWQYPDRDFRQIVRMDRQSFVRLLEKIQNHPIFTNHSNN